MFCIIKGNLIIFNRYNEIRIVGVKRVRIVSLISVLFAKQMDANFANKHEKVGADQSGSDSDSVVLPPPGFDGDALLDNLLRSEILNSRASLSLGVTDRPSTRDLSTLAAEEPEVEKEEISFPDLDEMATSFVREHLQRRSDW